MPFSSNPELKKFTVPREIAKNPLNVGLSFSDRTTFEVLQSATYFFYNRLRWYEHYHEIKRKGYIPRIAATSRMLAQ